MNSLIQLRLRISGVDYIIPTFENTSLQLTRSVQSLDSISSDQKTLSEQTFRVPFEKEIIEAIGDIADPKASVNIDLRKTIDGFILIDGYEAYEGGFTVIGVIQNPNTDAREIELYFRGNESSLKAQLEQLKLTDLFAGETIPYTITEIHSYLANVVGYANTNGYAWDLIDYGQDFYSVNGGGSGVIPIDDPANPLNQTNFKPSVLVQKVFDKAADSLGITFTNHSSIDNLMLQRMPLHNNESNLPALDTSEKDYTGFMDRTNTINYVFNSPQAGAVTQFNFNQATNFNQAVFNVLPDNYTAQVDGIHVFQLNVNIDAQIAVAPFVSTAVIMAFQVYKNGVLHDTLGSVGATVNLTASIDFRKDFNIDLVAGDILDVRFSLAQVSTSATQVTYQQQTDTYIECVASPSFTSNSEVQVERCINEDLTAWDFVKTIIAQCNGILTRDGSTYDITPWVTWVDDNSDIVELDTRVDITKDVKIEPTSVKGAKSIVFTYQDGEDFYNEKFRELQGFNYGSLKIADTGSDFATQEYKIELPFCNAVPVPISGSDLTTIKMIDTDGEIVNNTPMLYSIQDNTIGVEIRLKEFFSATTFFIIGARRISNWVQIQTDFNDDDNNFGTTLNFFAASGFPNNTLYERFWRRYIREVYGEKSRKYEMSVEINPTEFLTWVLNERLLYKGAYFRFNSISNFNLNKNQPTKIEVVQRLDLLNSDIAPYYPDDVVRGVVNWRRSSDNVAVGDGSLEPAADIEANCIAYGFSYDSTNNIGIQVGQILPLN